MIGIELIHISREDKIRVLSEPFLHSLNEAEKGEAQVVIVEYLQGDSAARLDIVPVDHLPVYWKVLWQEDFA